jgi:hypothetical protein
MLKYLIPALLFLGCGGEAPPKPETPKVSKEVLDSKAKSEGYGDSKEEAKADALRSLISKIFIEVKSSFFLEEGIAGFKAFKNMKKSLKAKSSSSLIGVEYSEPKSENGFFTVTAYISSETENLYLKKLETLKSSLEKNFKTATEKKKFDEKIVYLQGAMEKWEEFHKYLHVANFLKLQNIPELAFSKEEIRAELARVEIDFGNAESGNLEAKITTNLGNQNPSFAKGDSVEIYAHLTRSGCFVVIGYSKEVSYFLEVGNGDGIFKFVKCVGSDEVGKDFLLGKFNVSPPFGEEKLDLIYTKNQFRNEDFEKLGVSYSSQLGVYTMGVGEKEVLDAFVKSRLLTLERDFQISSLRFTTSKE